MQLGHYYEIGKIIHSDTIIFKISNLNQKSSHKLDAKGMNFKNSVLNCADKSCNEKSGITIYSGRYKYSST